MPQVYTWKDGLLRIYDAFEAADATVGTEFDCYVYDDSLASYTQKATEAKSKSGSLTGTFFVDANDALYIGFLVPFTSVGVNISTAAVGTSTLVAKYWNGSIWTALGSVTDGTASGGDCFAQDGNITFAQPTNWAKNDPATAGVNLYYVQITSTSIPGTPPNAEYVGPNSGQYLSVPFIDEGMTFVVGHAKPEEMLILDRGLLDGVAHYIEGSDAPIYEAVPLTIRAKLDDSLNKTALKAALTCGNASKTNWMRAGVSTKGDTQNDGANANPAFADAQKKAVCVQVLWGSAIGRAFNEVYFPPAAIQVEEADDGVRLVAEGLVYGTINEITAFRYTANSLS